MTKQLIAQHIVESGVYKTYWGKPKEEWPVSEQGRICPAYCNLRSLVGNVSMRGVLLDGLDTAYKDLSATSNPIAALCGIVSAGVPWATWLSDRLNLPLAYARPSTKAYGQKNGIEGLLEPGNEVVLVDDVVLTGSTITKTSLQLANMGVKVAGVVALLRLSDEPALVHQPSGAFEEVPVHTVSDYANLVSVSLGRGDMNLEQSRRLIHYYQNPGSQPWA